MDLRQVADAIGGARGGSLRLRQGVCTASASGTLSVKIAGSTVEVTGVKCVKAASYPAVNDKVWLLTDGIDVLCLGGCV